MSEAAIKDFLAQFSASKKNVDEWAPWMKESAKVATASFPKPHHENAQQKHDSAQPRVNHQN